MLSALGSVMDQSITVALLCILIVLIAAGTGQRRWVLRAAIFCIGLAVASVVVRHGFALDMWVIRRCVVGVCAIMIATMLILRNLGIRAVVQSQALLLAQTHDSVTMRDLSGRLTYWNKASAALYGWSDEQAQGVFASSLLQTTYPVAEDAIMAMLLATGGWEGEVVNRTRDGRLLTLHTRWSLLRDDRGRPTGILEAAKDITESRKSDLELRIGEARYRNIFQTMAVAIWECDFSRVKARNDQLRAEGVQDFRAYVRDNPGYIREAIDLSRAVDVNDASVRLFEAGDRETLLRDFSLIWPKEGEPVYAAAMMAALENRLTYETQAVLQTVHGRRLDVLFSVSYPPGTGSRESIFVAAVDITESNKARADLDAAQVDLAHAMRLSSLGELTATIAHEVNQPLGGVVANGRAALRWLERDPPELAEVRHSIEQSIAEAQRAADVLGKTRAMARKSEPQIVPVDVNALIAETIQLLAREIGRVQASLDLDLEPTDGRSPADRIQIQQVIINLILNSLQALADIDGHARRILVQTRVGKAMIVVRIDDTGRGVAPDQRARLFTPFFTTKDAGLGIGLSVCGSIVERHGGRIEVIARDGPGLCIQFSLPLAMEE